MNCFFLYFIKQCGANKTKGPVKKVGMPKSGTLSKSERISFREIDLFLYFTKILCEVDIGINQFHEKKNPSDL